ncbi:MAG: PepSY domain-containing protein [Chroococcidiopsidaceae cyanobacterium CP_BM_ER_R8_30]|nr:PepSY domain-containing protein [Chroococcidiopsidaceae cyanobacterium CP_BM_ER_R8_30]
MKTSAKLAVAAAYIGSLWFVVIAQTVQAAQSSPQATMVSQPQSYTQIAEASDGDGEANNSAKEQTEATKLQSLAKITPQQAQQSAETAQGGRASRVKLEDENGNLVYAVTIGQQELLVDAGNGRVLSSSNPNTEQNEGIQTRSSIQVPNSSRRDSENNDSREK